MITIKKYTPAAIFLALGIVAALGVASVFSVKQSEAATGPATGALTPSTYQSGTYNPYTFFSATTTTGTSTPIVVVGAKRISFNFTHGGVATTSTGGATFKVSVSTNGTDYIDFFPLIGTDVAFTATTSVAIQGATSTQMYTLDLTKHSIYSVKCIETEFTSGGTGVQGEHTCNALITY